MLSMADLSKDELCSLLELAAKLKSEQKAGTAAKPLEGRTLGMIFAKSSTRTRVSFDVGVHQLGGSAVVLNTGDIQLGRGETIEDTAKVLSRYLDGIMIRTFKHTDVEELARHASIPVINGLTDDEHPCQVLADFQTVIERKGRLDGLKLCYIGDGNNMANSLIYGGLTAGMSVSCACPDGYHPLPRVLEFAKGYPGRFELSGNILRAARDADVLVTDVWASMGQESEIERRRVAFAGYQINDSVLAVANPDAIVLHCLPAHRGEEISAEVFARFADVIYDEAENRLHAQKAVMVRLMNK